MRAAIMLWSLYAVWAIAVVTVVLRVVGRMLTGPKPEPGRWEDSLPAAHADLSIYYPPGSNGTITTLMVLPYNARYKPRRRGPHGTVYGPRPSPWEAFQLLPPERKLARAWWSARIRLSARYGRRTRKWPNDNG